MSLSLITIALTVVAAVIVVLTRLWLRAGWAGRTRLGTRLPWVHAILGVIALVVWIVFIAAPASSVLSSSSVGILAVGLWWLVAVAGVLMLLGLLPSRGRHISQAGAGRWSDGLWLSLLAHLAMLGSVIVFTYAYLTAAV